MAIRTRPPTEVRRPKPGYLTCPLCLDRLRGDQVDLATRQHLRNTHAFKVHQLSAAVAQVRACQGTLDETVFRYRQALATIKELRHYET